MKKIGEFMRFRSLFLMALCMGMSGPVWADTAMVEEGKALALDRKKGNCASCHLIQGAVMPGNISVPLIAMKTRFPDRKVLRENIWNQTKFRPHAMMPPFGKHGILSEQEIDKIVEYIHTL